MTTALIFLALWVGIPAMLTAIIYVTRSAADHYRYRKAVGQRVKGLSKG